VHVAYVTPRYGREVVGGAELGVRMFAERLVEHFGWRVDVLTSSATDLRTWANDLASGETVEEGVNVHRFPTTQPRTADFDTFGHPLLSRPARASLSDSREWVRRQGPHSPALLDAISASPADLVVFYPYLYEPTVVGIESVGTRAVLHPAAHDEAPIRLPAFRPVFRSARGLVFQTYAEARFVNKLFDTAATRQLVLGLGSDPQPGEEAAARTALRLDDRPYLLSVGRVDDGKGTGTLARFFAAYKDAHPGPMKLVLAGPVVHQPAAHPDIVVAGVVDEAVKWGLLRGALALVNASGFEAFSLVLVEAWHAGRPVLVNGRCFATSEHCARSNGGLVFDDYASFAHAVDTLTCDAALGDALGQAGKAYVEAEFTWPAILARYRAFLETVLAHRP